jgi:ribose transport system substrate-binding protein
LSRYHLVVVIPDLKDSFFDGLLKGLMADLDLDPGRVAVQVFRYPSTSPAEAEQYFAIAVRAKVDGLVMYVPRNDRRLGRPEEAARSGVIFIPVGTDPPPEAPPGFIGLGAFDHGHAGGVRITRQLGHAARIGVILPTQGFDDARDDPFYQGLQAALRDAPGAAIVATALTQPDVLSGEETVLTLLRANPSINAIFCAGAKDTIGAAQVVVDLNRVGNILIIGTDETQEIRHYVDKGVIAATIIRDSVSLGRQAMKAFLARKEAPVQGRPGAAP